MTGVRSVLMFSPMFRPIVGGAERQAEKLSRALVRKGLRVKLVTPRLVAGTPSFEDDCGVEIHRFPLLDLGKIVPIRGIGPLNIVALRHQTLRAVWKHMGDAQIVHTRLPSAQTSVFAMQAAHRCGVPFLCTAATGGQNSDLGFLAACGISGPILARLMLKQADFWVALTQAAKEALLRSGVLPDKIMTIPNGVELPAAHVPRRGPVRRFLYLGRLATTAERDVPTLIRAFDSVADKIPDIELAIVGDGDLFGETKALVGKARNGARIHMPGTQPPDPWLEWAHCFVLPSFYEGLSNALLEAMAWGLPCIANDIPQNREALDDGRAGILVPVKGEEQLTSAILKVATDEAVASVLGNIALKRAREVYCIDAVAGQYVQLYNTLLKNPVMRLHGTR